MIKFLVVSAALTLIAASITGCSGLDVQYEFADVETEKGIITAAEHAEAYTTITPIIDYKHVSVAVRHIPERYSVVIESATHTWKVTGKNAKIIFRRVEGTKGVALTVSYRKMYRAVYRKIKDGKPELLERTFVDNEFLDADLD